MTGLSELSESAGVLRPNWRVPASVRALYSVRGGGVSDSPFSSFNLSATVGDEEGSVGENRMRLRGRIPSGPRWMRQAHTSRVLPAEEIEPDATVADASYTFSSGVVCAVLAADCLPVLFCLADGSGAAAAHAGWRGLAGGVLENTAAALRGGGGAKLLAWLGPAVSAAHYGVGGEVREALMRDKSDGAYFRPSGKKWLADLPALARRRLADLGVETTASGLCTYSDSRRFFSARRDGGRCGRTASLIWLESGGGLGNGDGVEI